MPACTAVLAQYETIRVAQDAVWEAAVAAGTVTDLPANHSPLFLPVVQPTLQTGTEALVVAAGAWLAP